MAALSDKKGKKLIITVSGGRGHIQAEKAQIIKVLSEFPNAEVIQKDILIDLASKRLGQGFVYF